MSLPAESPQSREEARGEPLRESCAVRCVRASAGGALRQIKSCRRVCPRVCCGVCVCACVRVLFVGGQMRMGSGSWWGGCRGEQDGPARGEPLRESRVVLGHKVARSTIARPRGEL